MKGKSRVRRLSAATILGALALILLGVPASAGRAWCAKDPIVMIGGTPVQIWVAVPEEYQAYVKDAVKVKIKAPKHLERKTIFLDEGFNGHGEEVSWGDLKDEDETDRVIPVAVEVKVKFDKKQMEEDFGKDALEADLGKGLDVPLQITVNIGEVTETFEQHVVYGTNNKTQFALSVTSSQVVD